MNTSTHEQQRTSSRPVIFAVAGAAAAIALTGYGTFKGGDHSDDWWEWLLGIVILIATTVLVFGVFVRRALARDGAQSAARTARVLAVLAVATTVVYYLGFDAVLASGAICTALEARSRTGRWTALTGVAIALSVAAITFAVVFAITG